MIGEDVLNSGSGQTGGIWQSQREYFTSGSTEPWKMEAQWLIMVVPSPDEEFVLTRQESPFGRKGISGRPLDEVGRALRG
jgi:hypothetical protein